MTDPIQYRRATTNDILTICDLGQLLNAVHHEAHPTFFAPATESFGRDAAHWMPSLVEEDRATFIAEFGSAAVGFVTVQITQATSPLLQPLTVGRIGSIGVVDSMRGQGIGSALMRYAEQWAQQSGAKDLRLNVWTFNKSAAYLYQELGYEIRAFEMGKSLLSAE